MKKPDFLMNIGPNGEVFDPKRPLPVKKTLKVDFLFLFFFHLCVPGGRTGH